MSIRLLTRALRLRRLGKTRLSRFVVIVIVMALVGSLDALPASAAGLSSVTFTASNPQRLGQTNSQYSWGFTTGSSATLSKVTASVPPGTSGQNRYLTLPGVGGNYTSTSSNPTLSGNIDIRMQVQMSHWRSGGSYQRLFSKWTGSSNNASYSFIVDATHHLVFNWSPDGTLGATQNQSATQIVPYTDGQTGWVRMVFQPDNGAGGHTTTFYSSLDGITWTPTETPITNSGTATVFAGASDTEVGAADIGNATIQGGRVYYADLRSAINGTPVLKFDPNQAPATISTTTPSWTASTGESWGIGRTAIANPTDIASDLGVTSVSGIPSGGTAVLRQMDGTVTYNFASATAVGASVASSFAVTGVTNTVTPMNFTSAVTTYDNSGTPAAVDTGSVVKTFGNLGNTTNWQVMDPRTGIEGNRYDWTTPASTTATISKLTGTVPPGTTAQNRYLALNGTTGDYASTPDSTANSLQGGSFELRAKIQLSNWKPSTYMNILSKRAGVGSDMAFWWGMSSGNSGTMYLAMSQNGTTNTAAFSNLAVPATNGQSYWVRALVTFGSPNSSVDYYTSPDGNTWAHLGSTQSLAGITAMRDSAAALQVGCINSTCNSDNFSGRVYYADARSSLNTTTPSPSGCSTSQTIVSCFDPNQAPTNTSSTNKTWTSSSPVSPAEVWTVNRSGSGQYQADIAADLSVATVSGLPPGGTAMLRQIDATATYVLPSPTSITSGVLMNFGLEGFTNTTSTNSYTSTVTSWDNSATPVAVTSNVSPSLTISVPIINAVNAENPLVPAATSATTVSMAPEAVASYGSTIYIADKWAQTVLALDTTTGKVTRFAGSGRSDVDGNSGPATSAAITNPSGVSVDSSGNVFITDDFNGQIRQVTSGTISGKAGCTCYGFGGDGSAATAAQFKNPDNNVVAPNGDMYIADRNNNRIRKIDHTTLKISTIAGDGTCAGLGDNGPAASAELCSPMGLALDAAGDLFIADSGNSKIREIDTSLNITTVAGTGSASFSGDGGLATSATLNTPIGLAETSAGDLVIADQNNNRVRLLNHTTHFISTIGGSGTAGFSGDGAAATSAQFNHPRGITLDASDNIYVVDSANWRVRKFAVAGTISTVAGNGASPLAGDGGNVSSATFWSPSGLAADTNGGYYIADRFNNAVRHVDQYGNTSTTAGLGPNLPGSSGDTGTATAAAVNGPRSVAVDSAGTLYIADSANSKIRKVTTGGIITTLGSLTGQPYAIAVNPMTNDVWTMNGSCIIQKTTQGGATSTVAGTSGTCSTTGNGAAASAATVNTPFWGAGMAFDSAGDLYFPDGGNTVRKIDTNLIITKVAGGGASGLDNVPATTESLNNIGSISIDPLGYIYAAGSKQTKRFTDGGVITSVAATGVQGNSGDGGPATSATFENAVGSAIVNGTLMIADQGYNGIRKIADTVAIAPYVNADSVRVAKNTPLSWPVESNDWSLLGEMDPNSVTITTAPASGTAVVNINQGAITTITYTPPAGASSGTDSFVYKACDSTLVLCGSATVSVSIGSDQVTTVVGGVTEGQGFNIGFTANRVTKYRNYLFYTDGTFDGVRRYDIYSGQLVFIAGNASPSNSGDGGPATAASMQVPLGIAVTPTGTIYVADQLSSRIRAIATNGTISTIAGNGSTTNAADGTAALSSGLNSPNGLAIGPTGAIYLSLSSCVRTFVPGGTLSTFAGSCAGTGASGDGGAATSATMNGPSSMAFDSSGNFFVADTTNNAIREVTGGIITTVAGTLGAANTFSGNGVAATTALFNTPTGLAVDSSNRILVADTINGIVRGFTVGGTITTLQSIYDVDGLVAGSTTDYYTASGFNSGTAPNAYINTAGTKTNIVNAFGEKSYAGDGLKPSATQIDSWSQDASSLADGWGNIYIGERNNPRIRKYNADTGVVTTIAGNGVSGNTQYQINDPQGLALDPSGRVVFGEYSNCAVRRINLDVSLTVVAGTPGSCTSSGDGGQATAATIGNPMGVAYDSAGNLYTSEGQTNRIRKVTSGGIISTVMGNGTASSTGDGGQATAATMNAPRKLATDGFGNVYIPEASGQRIRMIDTKSNVFTVAGTGFANPGSSDGLAATATNLNGPTSEVVDSMDNLYVMDSGHAVIRKVDPTTGISTIVAATSASVFQDDTTYLAAPMSNLENTITIDTYGNIYVNDTGNHRVREFKGLASSATNAIASANWSVVPGATGHANLRELLTVTPAASNTYSKITATVPTSFAATPSVVSSFGIAGTTTATLSGTTLTVNFPSQTISVGQPIGIAIEGVSNGGTNGAYSSNIGIYDGAGTTLLGSARSNIVNVTSSGAPVSGAAGYSSVWNKSLAYTPSPTASVTVSPALGSLASNATTANAVLAGNLNGNALATKMTAPTSAGITLTGITPDPTTSVALAAITLNRYGVGFATTSGSSSIGTNYAGQSTSFNSMAAAANSNATFTFTYRMKIDYLTPAGQYAATLTQKLTPGT